MYPCIFLYLHIAYSKCWENTLVTQKTLIQQFHWLSAEKDISVSHAALSWYWTSITSSPNFILPLDWAAAYQFNIAHKLWRWLRWWASLYLYIRHTLAVTTRRVFQCVCATINNQFTFPPAYSLRPNIQHTLTVCVLSHIILSGR